MITKNDYWDAFYNNNKLLLPSQFAVFVANQYLYMRKSTVIDIGCGNGRIHYSLWIMVLRLSALMHQKKP